MVPVKRLPALRASELAPSALGSNDLLWVGSSNVAPKTTKAPSGYGASIENGAGEEIRTPDPRITNALLYQLSYTGTGVEAMRLRQGGGL
jgi:hypothetical protein